MIQKTSISTYDFEHFSRLNQIKNQKNNYLISCENNFSLISCPRNNVSFDRKQSQAINNKITSLAKLLRQYKDSEYVFHKKLVNLKLISKIFCLYYDKKYVYKND